MYKFFNIFFLLLLTHTIWGQAVASKKVLFVGNSYTYFWNLPLTVQVMSEKDSMFLETRQSTGGGMSLRQHWNHENNLKTKDIIENNKFDIIIIQDHSMQAINKPDSLLYYGRLWGELIRKSGAKVYLYTTWARQNDPQKQPMITDEYNKLAKDIDAVVVPVGQAWEKVRKLRPDIQLFDKDGSHPSPSGTYLSACVFYAVLSGKSPLGLSPRILTKDRNGEKLYLNIQSDDDAKFMQQLVEEMLFSK
ncbi:MAG: hypothetical protein RIR48_3470 [Bacteroidota bacterium]